MPSCISPEGPNGSRPGTSRHLREDPYRIAGQDYCRRHIIRAAVAAGIITD